MGLAQPDMVLACIQDHGFHPGKSNRLSRFRYWETFMRESEGRLFRLLYREPQPEMARLCALHQSIGTGLADTGAAAVLGAPCDESVEESAARGGVLIVNIGDSHTIAFLVRRNGSGACTNTIPNFWIGPDCCDTWNCSAAVD